MKLNVIRNSVKGVVLLLGTALVVASCQREELARPDGLASGDGVVRFAPEIASGEGVAVKSADTYGGTPVSFGELTSDDGTFTMPISCEVSTVDEPATKATLINDPGSATGTVKPLGDFAGKIDNTFWVAAWDATPSRIIPDATAKGFSDNYVAGSDLNGWYQKVMYRTKDVAGNDLTTPYWMTMQPMSTELNPGVSTTGPADDEYIWKKIVPENGHAETKTFFAYANLSGGATVTNTAATSQTLTLESLPNKDILLGYYSGEGYSGDPAKMTGTAGIHFYHPLTAVKFKKGTISDGVTITGISIKGVYTSGKTTQTPTTGTNFVWTKTNDNPYTAADETGTASLSSVTVDENGFIGDAIVLIPETFASDAARIEVTLSTPTGPKTVYYPLKGQNWAAGNTYVFTIGYDNSEYIRFSAPTAHSISFNFIDPAEGQTFSMQYSKDAVNWTAYTNATGPIDFGPSTDVYFRGINSLGLGKSPSSNVYEGCYFQISTGSAADVAVSGNIMSLINYDNTSVSIPSYAFADLFNGCTALRTANNLQLYAGTLSNGCYYQMFNGCKGLKNAPELFSQTLANYCYSNMFNGCINLKKAPVIHATTVKSACFAGMFSGCTSLEDVQSNLYAKTLASNCYDSMFNGCTSLEKAPVIHATTLANSCCKEMFRDCTSLVTVQPVLEAVTMAPYCYNYMFAGCTILKTAPDIMAQTLAQSCFHNMFLGCTNLENVQSDLFPETMASSCYSSMFNGCTSLKKAPVIHAETLARNCFYSMFYGCSNLQYVKCLAVSGFNDNCLGQFLTSVSSSGTFIYNHELGDEEDVRQTYVYLNTSGDAVPAIPEGWTVKSDTEE